MSPCSVGPEDGSKSAEIQALSEQCQQAFNIGPESALTFPGSFLQCPEGNSNTSRSTADPSAPGYSLSPHRPHVQRNNETLLSPSPVGPCSEMPLSMPEHGLPNDPDDLDSNSFKEVGATSRQLVHKYYFPSHGASLHSDGASAHSKTVPCCKYDCVNASHDNGTSEEYVCKRLSARQCKTQCKLRFVHSLGRFMPGYDSRGEWPCCRAWKAQRALSTLASGDGGAPKVLVFELLKQVDGALKLHGSTINCFLDNGCSARAIIQCEKAKAVGWVWDPRFRSNVQITTGSGHKLTPIGKYRLVGRDSETKVMIDVPALVVRKEAFPVAEGVLGKDVLDIKHLCCPNRLCWTRYSAKRPAD